MVVGVVGEGDVGVEQVGHRGGVQVAGIGVHHQLQLGALRLPGTRMMMRVVTSEGN